MKKFLIITFLLISKVVIADGYDVFSVGYFDVKLDNSSTDESTDFRYERRFDKSLFTIGPDLYDFFTFKPFVGVEITSDKASYFLTGIYLDDNVGTMLSGESSNFLFTPSFGVGVYENSDGKDLGNAIQFRTTLEFSYQLESKNRIGISFGHISNANLGATNPGVEIISLSYQIPY